MKPVFWLRCFGCIFHGTGNSAQLCENFGLNPPNPLSLYANWLRQEFLGGGGFQQIHLRTEGRENGDLGALAPSQGFHSICKWVNPVFWLGYRLIFHGTGNSAQLCQNFGISEGGLNPPVRHWHSVWPIHSFHDLMTVILKTKECRDSVDITLALNRDGSASNCGLQTSNPDRLRWYSSGPEVLVEIAHSIRRHVFWTVTIAKDEYH
jgi:hypothetical protein